MSKIAEKRAFEAYPLPTEEPETTSFVNQETFNSSKRKGYIAGYDQAIQDMLKDSDHLKYLSDEMGYAYACGHTRTMQDFLEKACEWLESRLPHCIENFKNYMQDEM